MCRGAGFLCNTLHNVCAWAFTEWGHAEATRGCQLENCAALVVKTISDPNVCSSKRFRLTQWGQKKRSALTCCSMWHHEHLQRQRWLRVSLLSITFHFHLTSWGVNKVQTCEEWGNFAVSHSEPTDRTGWSIFHFYKIFIQVQPTMPITVRRRMQKILLSVGQMCI